MARVFISSLELPARRDLYGQFRIIRHIGDGGTTETGNNFNEPIYLKRPALNSTLNDNNQANSTHPKLLHWVQEMTTLCQPESVRWCDGSKQEYADLCATLVNKGTAIPLNPELRPNSYLCRTDARDTGRVGERTFICSLYHEDAGPTNNWVEPIGMKTHLLQLFEGCMKGRTLYVAPFSLGPVGSQLVQVGVQITDSPYVVANMHILTRMGQDVMDQLADGTYIPCVHSLGSPLRPGMPDTPWPCNPEQAVVAHFPESREIWSYGSGYLSNALAAHESLGLRLASVLARDEGWLAEHMSILRVTSPRGRKKYFAAAFPSQCGKTHLATMTPTLSGWEVECLADNVAWLYPGPDDRLMAVNPEYGMYSMLSGISLGTTPNLMATINHNTIFTNVALTSEGDVWWEGMTQEPPANLLDWRGIPWTPEPGEPAAHPNAHFTAPLAQCPVVDPAWTDPDGVPIDAILFGGRRSWTVPLVVRSYNWDHGVWLGASLASETTAVDGETGKIRRNSFAMQPFCGYNMADYLSRWVKLGRTLRPDKLPTIYGVNWFLTSSSGKYLWPGYGENLRVLKWIFENLDGVSIADESPVGQVPKSGSLDLRGLDISALAEHELLTVDANEWRHEAGLLADYFQSLGDRLPPQLESELEALGERLLTQYLEAAMHPRPQGDSRGTFHPPGELAGNTPR